MDEKRASDDRATRGLRQLATLAAGSGCAGLLGGHVLAFLAMSLGLTAQQWKLIDPMALGVVGAGVVAHIISLGILLRLRSIGARTPHWAWILLGLGAVWTVCALIPSLLFR